LDRTIARAIFVSVEPLFRPLDSPVNRIDAVGRRKQMRIALVALLIAGLGLAYAAIMITTTPHTTPWRVAADGLYIDRPLDHDFYPKSELLLSAMKIIDLAESPAWRPAYREHGEGGMGYSAGAWTLFNGTKVRLHFAHESRAILIPRRRGRPVMIGIGDLDAFLAKARATWGVPAIP
jgi:hypothetical protein